MFWISAVRDGFADNTEKCLEKKGDADILIKPGVDAT